MSSPISLSPNTLRLLHPAYAGFAEVMYANYTNTPIETVNAFWDDIITLGWMSGPKSAPMSDFYDPQARANALIYFPRDIEIGWTGRDGKGYVLTSHVGNGNVRTTTFRTVSKRSGCWGVNLLELSGPSLESMLQDKYQQDNYVFVENGNGKEDADAYWYR